MYDWSISERALILSMYPHNNNIKMMFFMFYKFPLKSKI